MKNLSVWKIFKSNLRNKKPLTVLKEAIDSVASGKVLHHYLDALGVLHGEYAYKGPVFAQIDLTNDCNNDCIGCWCNSPLLEEKKIKKDIKSQMLPYRRVIRLIDELYKMGTRHLYFAGGGEPFMHPEIMDIIAFAKKRKMECFINTNFTLVDEKIIKEMVKLEVDSLTVSVWAGSPKIYAKTHPNKNEDTFNKIMNRLIFLNTIKKKLPTVKTYHVIFNMNYIELEKMVEFAVLTGSESVEFTVIDTIPDKTDRLLLNEFETKDLIVECLRVKEKYETGKFGNKVKLLGFDDFLRRISNSNALKAEYDSGIINDIPCYAGWAFVRILADGNVNSCLKSHRFPVGNILNDNFKTIWNCNKQRMFRKKTLDINKSDPFFSLIGNDVDAKMGCYKSCDNLGHNRYFHDKISKLSDFEKQVLRKLIKIK